MPAQATAQASTPRIRGLSLSSKHARADLGGSSSRGQNQGPPMSTELDTTSLEKARTRHACSAEGDSLAEPQAEPWTRKPGAAPVAVGDAAALELVRLGWIGRKLVGAPLCPALRPAHVAARKVLLRQAPGDEPGRLKQTAGFRANSHRADHSSSRSCTSWMNQVCSA